MPQIPQPDEDGIRRIQKDRKAEAMENNEWVLENSTIPELLIRPLECIVTDVYGISKKTFLHGKDLDEDLNSPGLKKYRAYFTGQESYLNISVRPKEECPVKELIFPGCWPIEVGDSIIAYILRGEFKWECEETWPYHRKQTRYNREDEFKHMVARDWLETEKPVYIEKLRAGKVVAMYADESREDIHFKPFVESKGP